MPEPRLLQALLPNGLPSVGANRHHSARSAQVVAWRVRRHGLSGYNRAGLYDTRSDTDSDTDSDTAAAAVGGVARRH